MRPHCCSCPAHIVMGPPYEEPEDDPQIREAVAKIVDDLSDARVDMLIDLLVRHGIGERDVESQESTR